MGTGVNFPEVKQTGRDVDHTPPSSAEVMNGVNTSNPLICHHGVDGDNFAFW